MKVPCWAPMRLLRLYFSLEMSLILPSFLTPSISPMLELPLLSFGGCYLIANGLGMVSTGGEGFKDPVPGPEPPGPPIMNWQL